MTPTEAEFFRLEAAVSRSAVEVSCGDSREVYQNLGDKDMNVTIQFTDLCSGSASELEVLGKNDKLLSFGKIEDSQTQAVTFKVPKNGRLGVKCKGANGKWSDTIIAAS
jgi:hypothetical protein